MSLSEVADLYIILRAVTKPFTDSMARAGAEGEAAGARVSGGIGKVSPVLMSITAATGLAAAASVKWASDFETQYTRLFTAAGASKDAVLANRDAILKLGTETGYTGTKIAEALYHPISAGLSLKDSLDAVRLSAEEAKISGANLDDTTYALSSVMKAFTGSNGVVPDATKTMAMLNAIVGDGDMRFQDFNTSIKNWAPTAASMGVSVQSMGSALSFLTDRGNKADEASTRVTMGLVMMSTPSAQAAKLLEGLGVASADVHTSSDAMTEALKKAHVTQNDLAKDLQKPDGIYVALSHLKKALSDAGVSGTEADSVLAKIFGGGRSDKAILSLMSNLDGLKQKYDQLGVDSSPKKFQQDWEDAQKTTAVSFDKLKAQVVNLGIVFGERLLPPLKVAMEYITKGISWMTDNKEAMIALAGVITGVVTVALYAIAKAFAAVAVAALANPWVDLIAAVLVGAVEIVTHWKTVKTFFVDLWDWIVAHKDIVLIVLSVMFPVLTAIGKAAYYVITHWKEIWAFLKQLGSDFAQWGKDVAQFFVHAWDDIEKWAKEGWEAAVKVSKAVWEDMKKAWSATVSFLKRMWDDSGGKLVHEIAKDWTDSSNAVAKEWHRVVDDLVSIWGSLVDIWNHTGGRLVHIINLGFIAVSDEIHKHWDAIKAYLTSIWETIWGVIRGELEIIKGLIVGAWDILVAVTEMIWGIIWGLIKAAWDIIVGIVKVGIDFVVAVMKAGWDLVKGVVETAWDIITGILNTALDLIKNTLKLFADLFAGRWSKLWDDIKGIAQGLWNDIYALIQGTLSDILKAVVSAAGHIVQGLVNGVKDGVLALWLALLDLLSTIWHFFVDAGKWLFDAGKAIVQGLVDGIKSMGSAVWDAITGIAGSITGGLGGIMNFGSPSKTMHKYGAWIGQGLANGIRSQQFNISDAFGDMTSSLASPEFAIGPSGNASPYSSQSANMPSTVNIYVGGSVLSDRDLRDVVQTEMLQLGARYSTSYTPYQR